MPERGYAVLQALSDACSRFHAAVLDADIGGCPQWAAGGRCSADESAPGARGAPASASQW
jgi:hypothetical protein